MQALSFGTTISFTGPTINDIIDDLSLCGHANDGNDDGSADEVDDEDDDGGLCDAASFLAAAYALSAMAGSVLAGPLSDHPKVGRRPVYLLNALVFVGGWVAVGTAASNSQIVVGRLLTGLGTGITG